MINSGQNISTNDTAGWTDYNQVDPCTGGTNATLVKEKILLGGNPQPIKFNKDMATNGGEIASAFAAFTDRWEAYKEANGINPWKMTLPVVNCPSNNIGTCEEVVGAVTVEVIWITGPREDPSYSKAPTQMGDWNLGDPDGLTRWNNFVNYYNLQNVDGSPAPYEKKSIYFLPSCEYHEPIGVSGGENFGILSKIPVLVR